jgi:hypothetical protein
MVRPILRNGATHFDRDRNSIGLRVSMGFDAGGRSGCWRVRGDLRFGMWHGRATAARRLAAADPHRGVRDPDRD